MNFVWSQSWWNGETAQLCIDVFWVQGNLLYFPLTHKYEPTHLAFPFSITQKYEIQLNANTEFLCCYRIGKKNQLKHLTNAVTCKGTLSVRRLCQDGEGSFLRFPWFPFSHYRTLPNIGLELRLSDWGEKKSKSTKPGTKSKMKVRWPQNTESSADQVSCTKSCGATETFKKHKWHC